MFERRNGSTVENVERTEWTQAADEDVGEYWDTCRKQKCKKIVLGSDMTMTTEGIDTGTEADMIDADPALNEA